jgi:hypothetical protein
MDIQSRTRILNGKLLIVGSETSPKYGYIECFIEETKF